MPAILYKYILRDLLRTFLLSVSVLVSVIAFGAAIKPLTHDQLLTFGQTLKYMGLAMVPMLQFALPFSAGFAATLTMHRMSSDNEIVAMAASGMSYRRVLTPIVGLGLVLLLIMVILTQWVIPRFWSVMHQTIATDVTRIFQASISRGEPFQVENLLLYANDMFVEEDPESDADTRMWLLGFVAVELDDDGEIETEVSARQAVVDVYRRSGQTHLMLAMLDTVVFDARSLQLSRTERVAPEQPWTVSTLLDDDLRTMTQARLLRLHKDPKEFSSAVRAREDLARAIQDASTRAELDRRLAADGRIELVQPEPSPRRYEVQADELRGTRFVRADREPITVVAIEEQRPVRRFAARRATLERSGARLNRPSFTLMLEDYEVTELSTNVTNRRSEIALTGLAAADSGELEELRTLPNQEMIERARELTGASSQLQQRAERLEYVLDDVRSEVRSRLGMRYALAITAPLLLLLGATLAIWLRGSLPLTVYTWAFLPSILDLIVISGGEQMIRDGKAVGWIVMWSGNLALLGFFALAYLRLSRN
ncbi:MAG: LptF/LptG family permease [Planctomycetota bacterium]|jgi:lipopolysaccharide export LptBFGC system permease protein LptF